VLFFAILGFIGLCSVCLTDTHSSRDPCYGCYGCYIGDCSGSCRGGGGDDGKALLVILVIMVVVLAFIGIFVGIFLATILFQKIIQRHMKVLWLKQEVLKYRVMDLYGRRELADAERPSTAVAVPMSPMMTTSDQSRVALIPSAPDMDSASYQVGKTGPKSYPDGLYEQ